MGGFMELYHTLQFTTECVIGAEKLQYGRLPAFYG